MIVIADTSGLIAALNADDPEHTAAAAALDQAGLVVVSPLSLVEIDHVVTARASRKVADRVLDQIRARAHTNRTTIAGVKAEDIGVALALRRRYSDLRLDLTDAVVVGLAARFHTDTILTLDRRDFRVVRPLTRHPAFRLLPDAG